MDIKTKVVIVICAIIDLIFIIDACNSLLYIIRSKMRKDEIMRIPQQKCQEYLKVACQYPSSQEFGKIILGEEAPLGMFPHMAYLVLFSKTSLHEKKCGGSLISEKWILSAAHCASNLPNVMGQVKLGSVSRLFDGSGQIFDVEKAILHPDFDENQGTNDMLLVQLKETVKFNSNVRPICLNLKLLKYEHIFATGWGATEDEFSPFKLRMVRLYIDKESTAKCKGLQMPYLICAGHPNASKSTHMGDSGGPLQVPLYSGCSNTYELIGVTHAVELRPVTLNETLLSWYSKVEVFIPWIVTNVWADEL